MKKIILLLGIAAFVQTGSLNAQETKIGFKGGLQSTNFGGDDADDADLKSKFGILVGGFATLKFTENLAFQPEILFSDKGAATDDDDKLTLSYLDVPLLAKFYLNDNFNFHAGPQLGLLLSADFEGDDLKDQFKDIDFGAAIGFEYEANLGLVIGARYNFGFSSVGEDYEETSSFEVNGVTTTTTVEVEAADYSNRAIQVYVGFGF